MGYKKLNGKWADTDDAIIQEGITRTATANGAAVEVGERSSACLELVVTAGSGTTPTLDVTIETSKDGTGTGLGAWRSLGAFAQRTAAGSERKSFTGLDRFVRAVQTIGGTTPSFTYSIAGELKG